ncbi:MAG: alpha/beta fold hydrolase, partial [Myxococcota bacterium]
MRATPAPDPLVLLAGGPGQSAVESYVATEGAYALIRRTRDILLIDQRGTGRSARLDCSELEDSELEAKPSNAAIRDAVKRCLDELPHNPKFFTTSVAVRDLERVRRALGVPRWNLYGISYGTRVAAHYLRRYPEAVRVAILDGVVGVDRVLGPDIAERSQQTLDALFARCRSERACHERFGDPSAILD